MEQMIKDIKFKFGKDNPLELCKKLQAQWRWKDYFIIKKGFTFGKAIWKIEMHTGGWSDHEEIIRQLQKTDFFMFHTKWEQGGHWYFEFEKKKGDVYG